MDREHRLNAALLRSGKFKEAIATLMEWMRKMDDTLAEQKLTSTDHKFLKSQLQMQQVTIVDHVLQFVERVLVES